MDTKLGQFAEQLLRRHRQPRVLDYETPPPAITWRDHVSSVVGWVLDHPCLSLFIFGVLLCWAGSHAEPPRVARALAELGLLLALVAVKWWGLRPPKW